MRRSLRRGSTPTTALMLTLLIAAPLAAADGDGDANANANANGEKGDGGRNQAANGGDSGGSDASRPTVAALVDQLDAADYAKREDATAALMQDERLDEAGLKNALGDVASPEQRHRLIRIALHRYFRQLNPSNADRDNGRGALGIDIPPENIVQADQHSKLDHPAMLITRTRPGFPAFVKLRPGDLILGIAGRRFDPSLDQRKFIDLVQRYDAGDEVELQILRDGERQTVTLTLDSHDRLEDVYQRISVTGHVMLYQPWQQHLRELLEGAADPSMIDLSGAANAPDMSD